MTDYFGLRDRGASPRNLVKTVSVIFASLCLWFIATASFANSLTEARQTQRDLFGSAPLETIDAFEIACSAGDTDACENAQETQAGEYHKPKKGFSALKSTCRDGDGPSCMAKGLWEQNGIGTKVDLADAKQSFADGCAASYLPACYMSIKLAERATGKTSSLLAMLDLCEKGLDAGCVGQSDYIQASNLTNSTAASEVIGPLVKACEKRASLCKFGSLIDHFASAETQSALNYLVGMSGDNSRKAIADELLIRLKSAAGRNQTAPEVVAVLQTFMDNGRAIASPEMTEAAAEVPAVLAILLDGDIPQDTLDEQARIALLSAAQNGQVEAAKALLAKGANPDVRNGGEIGWTPLQLAAVNNDVNMVETLLAAGADPTFPNTYGSDPLMSAAKRGHIDIMQRLLSAGADVWRTEPPTTNMTAVHYAASENQLQALALLIKAGANIETQDAQGRTALEYAVVLKNKDMVGLLLTQGADINRPTSDGRQYLDVAIQANDIEMVRSMLEAGANPNQRDANGETPLFHAIRSGNEALAGILLDSGADGTIISDEGLTPSILYANLEEDRRQKEAAAERARQQKIAAQRQAEARRRAEAQRKAAKKKKRSGLLGGLVGIAAGAAIGTEMGLSPEQLGEFTTTMGTIGMAAEKGTAASLQDAKRSVDGLGARLAAAAPPAPQTTGSFSSRLSQSPATQSTMTAPSTNASEAYAQKMREMARLSGDATHIAMTDAALNTGGQIGQALADQRNFENELARRRAELAAAQRAVAEAEARQRSANIAAQNSVTQSSGTQTYVPNPQPKTNGNTVHRQRTLTMTIPTLRNCMTIADEDSPNYGGSTCDTPSQRQGDGPQQGDGTGNPRYADNNGYNGNSLNSGGNGAPTNNGQGDGGYGSDGTGTVGNGGWSSGNSNGNPNSTSNNGGDSSDRNSGPKYKWVKTQRFTVETEYWRDKPITLDLLETKLENELARFCNKKYDGNIEYSTVRISGGSLERKRASEDRIQYRGEAVGDGYCRVGRYDRGYSTLTDCPAGPQNPFCPVHTKPTRTGHAELYMGGLQD